MKTAKRWLSYWLWAYLAWIVLTWTEATEDVVFGAVAAAVVAVLLMPLGEAARPWRLLVPGRLVLAGRTAARVMTGMVKANISLSRRIWSRKPPLRPGMVVVPTRMRSDGGLTAVGLLTSLVVDNQVVDVDRGHHQLQYHGVWFETDAPAVNGAHVNGPLEELLSNLEAG